MSGLNYVSIGSIPGALAAGDAMTRLAITADLHALDSGSKVDEATGLNARWVDSVEMIRWVANDARKRNATALIVAGDFTEARHPAPWRVHMIQDALDDFGGPTILLRGNHDGERAGRSVVDVMTYGRHDDRWHGESRYGFSRPGVVVVGEWTNPPVPVAVACLPYLDRHWLRSQPGFEQLPDSEVFRALAEQFLAVAGGLYAEASRLAERRVLVVHQGLSGGLMSDTQRAFLGDLSLVVDSRALGAQGWDAIVAGHFHLHQVLSTDPLIAYAGAPTRTDFGEEHQEKGYLIVDVDEAGVRMEFVPTPARRFVTIDASAWPENPEHGGPDASILRDAIVRIVNLPPEDDVAQVRRTLENEGAFDITEIRRRPVVSADAGGISESLSPEAALEEYFADDDDREALVDRGRGILAEVAG